MAYREKDTKKWTAQWFETNVMGEKKKRRKKWPIFLGSPSLTYQDLKRKLCRDCDAKWYAMNSKL